MIAILVGLIALGALAVCVLKYSYRSEKLWLFAGLLGTFCAFVASIGLIIWSVCAGQWFGAEHKARIINETFGTHYTQAEVFWAEDVIDEVRELKRKRIELNGDLFRDEKP